MNVESNFAIALILHGYVLDWLKNLVPFSQPIRSEIKTNPDLLAHIFPRLAPATCSCFKL